MKEIFFQKKGKVGTPFSQEELDKWNEYAENQVIRAETYGVKKIRSVQQNKWIHVIFGFVAANTENPEWDTPKKVKRNVKMAMKFFKDDVIVQENKVWFELRSFAFDKMEQNEADKVYNEAKDVCAKFLKCDPDQLQAEASNERT